MKQAFEPTKNSSAHVFGVCINPKIAPARLYLYTSVSLRAISEKEMPLTVYGIVVEAAWFTVRSVESIEVPKGSIDSSVDRVDRANYFLSLCPI
ncbi:hypothetical protein CEXT_573331 [Caerostris extrusa]|uniref:Uncharacterized protein n=1 Tax=Caerostris extrusa TaxID=172846 RepID=A0AAV4XVL2_CAEEX|nr:hypothetical protein CEXT_573331 [Caerostris extrusa]